MGMGQLDKIIRLVGKMGLLKIQRGHAREYQDYRQQDIDPNRIVE